MTTQEENAAMDALRAPIDINYNAIVPCEESMRLAVKLGTHFARHLTRIQIEECLRDCAIAIYPLESVRLFMDRKVEAMTKTNRTSGNPYYRASWGWHALRACDLQRPRGIGSIAKRYEKPVPIPVLLTVEKIQDFLGPQVRFYVADVRETTFVDPFLCVTAEECPIYVIERWDEPAFRSS
jgi:hypothetical protein